jgi:small neutral amino acid transporter SnatA (MarC family)
MKSATTLKVTLATSIAVKCAFVVSCAMQLQLISRAPFSLAEAHANDQRQQILVRAGLAVFVVVLVAYLVWFYQSKRRSIELGASKVEYSPGLSVGCHFIPFGNLFMPFKAMSELWRASVNPTEWNTQRLSPIVGLWWASWLINGVFGYVVFFAAKSGRGLDHLRLVTVILIIQGMLTIAANSLLLLMASRIAKRLDNSPRNGPPKLMPNPHTDPTSDSGTPGAGLQPRNP